MGCGMASMTVVPATLGRGKFVKSWRIASKESESARTVTVDFSRCEDEGMVDVGTLERSFPIHCTISWVNQRFQTVS